MGNKLKEYQDKKCIIYKVDNNFIIYAKEDPCF